MGETHGDPHQVPISKDSQNYKKRAARIILHAEFRTPSATMFQELGWLSIPKRLIYN